MPLDAWDLPACLAPLPAWSAFLLYRPWATPPHADDHHSAVRKLTTALAVRSPYAAARIRYRLSLESLDVGVVPSKLGLMELIGGERELSVIGPYG